MPDSLTLCFNEKFKMSPLVPAVLRLPGAVRAVAVPLRAALHALLRAQAAPLHHVADGHETPESCESLSLQRLSFRREKERGGTWKRFERSPFEGKSNFKQNFCEEWKFKKSTNMENTLLNVTGVQGVDDVVRGPGKRQSSSRRVMPLLSN